MAAGRIALVIALTLERPTCLDCIARSGAMTVDDVEVALQMIAAFLEFHTEPARCSVCGKATRVFSVQRPPSPPA
jgi:hypothetical protein